MDSVELNKVFHDHECAYYDERFAIKHDDESAQRARREVEDLLGRALTSGEVVLDVGCGTGWFCAGLQRAAPDVVVIGLDLSTGMLTKAQEAGADYLVQGDATALPFADDSIDVVVGRGVLHHLPEPLTALQEWNRVLRADGELALSSEPTPIVESDGARLLNVLLKLPGLNGGMSEEDQFWELAAMAANLHTFTKAELEQLLTSADFGSVDLSVQGFAETLVMTASYATHGHAPSVARRIPWPIALRLGGIADKYVWNRVLPESRLHTLAGTASTS